MIFLYFIPIMLIGALMFERMTDPSRRRRRAVKREYGNTANARSRRNPFSRR